MKILVTGASGFIGSSLISYIIRNTGFEVAGMVRSENLSIESLNIEMRIGDLSLGDEFGINLKDIDVIVHTAGRAHVMPGNFHIMVAHLTLSIQKVP